MEGYKKSVKDHYGQTNLGANIMAAYGRVGKKIQAHEDTASFDEFHIQRGMKVLDIGCGIGGPARTLAAEFGCVVTGIDLIEEYCETAEMLAKKVGLDDKVTFHHGDIMDLPFEEQTFDVVWTEHTIMNIEDKARMFNSVRRMLQPKGLLALYEICAGSLTPPYFPVPWASDSTINFLVTPEQLHHMLGEVGFMELQWRDLTSPSLEWFRGLIASMAARPSDAPPPLGLNLLMGKTAAEKATNVVRNLEEDRIRVVQGVFLLKE
jgi:SAM-dependent methyltransferase